jgi:hypothetical protein
MAAIRQQMLLLDQQRRADTLISSSNASLLVASAVVTQPTIQFRQIDGLRHWHPVIPAKVAGHAALLMPFGRCAELTVESPVRPECDEPRRLFPSLTAQDLLYRSLQVVVILLPPALCGLGRARAVECGAQACALAHNGLASEHHDLRFGTSERRLSLCSNAISSSLQRSTASGEAG